LNVKWGDEVDEWRSGRDPIVRLQKQMIEAGLSTEAEFKQKDKDIKKEVVAVAKAAEAQPEPDLSALWDDIITDEIPNAYPYPRQVGIKARRASQVMTWSLPRCSTLHWLMRYPPFGQA